MCSSRSRGLKKDRVECGIGLPPDRERVAVLTGNHQTPNKKFYVRLNIGIEEMQNSSSIIKSPRGENCWEDDFLEVPPKWRWSQLAVIDSLEWPRTHVPPHTVNYVKVPSQERAPPTPWLCWAGFHYNLLLTTSADFWFAFDLIFFLF